MSVEKTKLLAKAYCCRPQNKTTHKNFFTLDFHGRSTLRRHVRRWKKPWWQILSVKDHFDSHYFPEIYDQTFHNYITVHLYDGNYLPVIFS
jgi:hypothetical protein